MVLSGEAIQKLIDKGVLKVSPEVIIKEASIKIHLPEDFTPYKLKPKEFTILKSKESFEIPDNLAGFYDGYTHLARKGVTTHMGSMFVDPGSKGPITLEVFNASDEEVLLEPNMRVGHLVLLQVVA